MADVRADREAAFWLAWRKGLRDDPRKHLPGYLDELERIDRETVPVGIVEFKGEVTDELLAALQGSLLLIEGGTVAEPPEFRVPTAAEVIAWIDAHPDEFNGWAGRNGTRVMERLLGGKPATAPAGHAAKAPGTAADATEAAGTDDEPSRAPQAPQAAPEAEKPAPRRRTSTTRKESE